MYLAVRLATSLFALHLIGPAGSLAILFTFLGAIV
jgi:hypothetical protein